MFELNAVEIATAATWVVGIVVALMTAPRLSTARRGIGLVLLAVLLPVVGSVAAIVIGVLHRRRARGRRATESAPPAV